MNNLEARAKETAIDCITNCLNGEEDLRRIEFSEDSIDFYCGLRIRGVDYCMLQGEEVNHSKYEHRCIYYKVAHLLRDIIKRQSLEIMNDFVTNAEKNRKKD